MVTAFSHTKPINSGLGTKNIMTIVYNEEKDVECVGNKKECVGNDKETVWRRFFRTIENSYLGWKEASYNSYQPTNEHWELAFKELGWSHQTIESFWKIFCRINSSCTGEISFTEFLEYFELHKTRYTKRCFEYFNTTGGNSIDFLEFMISVWNVCTTNPDTLTNFAFDLYNLNSDGELSYPEMEILVEELYGKEGKTSGNGKQCLTDLTYFAERSGGTLSSDDFSIFALHHSMLLFPAFQIQQSIQQRVQGLRFWERVREQQERRLQKKLVGIDVCNPRHVQIILRTYKAKGAVAVLRHTGDPTEALREWFNRKHEAQEIRNVSESIEHPPTQSWWEKLSAFVLNSQSWIKIKEFLHFFPFHGAIEESPQIEEVCSCLKFCSHVIFSNIYDAL